MIHLPTLSEYDPTETSEGSLDPLGLYAISDALAVRLVPGVRQRQTNPRFLTATSVSLAVCSEFDDERVAADGVSPPWQVFEWYMVEGLVRRPASDPAQNKGLPGQQKVARAIRDKIPLSAPRYLKNPRTFGFHGIYRVLAKMLDVEVADRLGGTGYDLLQTWADEQGLSGFYGSTTGSGRDCRKQLVQAVEDGLNKGHVCRSEGWSGWDFFRDHLVPYAAGPRERAVLTKALTGVESGYLREIWEYLISKEGKTIWGSSESERKIHAAMLANCSDGLRDLIGTILEYETFARLLQDAFDDCLRHLSKSIARTRASDLVELDSVRKAANRIPDLYAELQNRLEVYGVAFQFQESFSGFAEPLSPLDWVVGLLKHHMVVQRRKPPDGKAPWFDQFDDGSFIIRPTYLRDEGGRHDEEYVHMYRCRPLMDFAGHLGHLG